MKKFCSSLLSAIVCTTAIIQSPASAFDPKPDFSAAFLQTFYCRQWDAERWEKEFSYAKGLGIDTLIIPSVLEIQHQFFNTFWGDQPEPNCYSMFPLETTTVAYDVNCDGDSLKLALEAAKAADMKLWIGTIDDNSFSYSLADASVSSYEMLSINNSDLSNSLMAEIWSRYGKEYGEQIAGWYYSGSFCNFKNACNGTDDGALVQIISENINTNIALLDELCPDKPLMLNPYYYYDNSTAEQFGTFLSELLAASELRPIDIYAAKAENYMPAGTDTIRQWTEAQKAAVEDKMHFWVENSIGIWSEPTLSMEKLFESYTATNDLAEENIISYSSLFADYNDKSKEYFSDFMSGTLIGDVNDDGKVNVADLTMLQKWLLGVPDAELINWKAADLCKDEYLDSLDLCMMRKNLINDNNELITEELEEKTGIIVHDTDELFNAVENAKPGDIIKVAPGQYILNGKTLTASADGTEEQPICIKPLDYSEYPVFRYNTTKSGYVMHITGDYWNVEGIKFTEAQKGIVLDNSNHSVIYDCEIYNIGAEAIAIRDGSSYCTVNSCRIGDTGLVSPGYGEGVYIGSSKEKTEFEFKCDHNKVIDCIFKNVAAEHIDVKEYTTDTEISGCIFYGKGMTGENYAGSFIDIKGNECYVHDNIGYREGNPQIVAAFEIHEQVPGWGYHHFFENNTLYMDQPYGAKNTNRRMYIVDGWFSDFKVKGNRADYGEGLVAADQKLYYNCDNVTIIQDQLSF